ncbi:CBS domain-containing protein [Nonomuraea monospora]
MGDVLVMLVRGEFEADPRATMLPPRAAHEPPPRRVMEVMTREPVTVTETTDVTRVIDLMVGKRVKSLPVVRDERVVGMVSRRDLMATLARPDEELRSAVVEALREHYPFGLSWDVTVRDGVAELSGPPHEHADHIADLLAGTVPGIVRVKHLRRGP